MNNLNIQVAENGFIIHEGDIERHMAGRQWAFETAESLATFIKGWGSDIHKPDETLPTLEKGKALIITGGKGVGKTTKAIQIADMYGNHTLTTFGELIMGNFSLGRVLESEPDVVIIEDELDEFSESDKFFKFIKPLIVLDNVQVDRQHEKPIVVKTPHFIICTGAIDPLKLEADERRFTVLPL